MLFKSKEGKPRRLSELIHCAYISVRTSNKRAMWDIKNLSHTNERYETLCYGVGMLYS